MRQTLGIGGTMKNFTTHLALGCALLSGCATTVILREDTPVAVTAQRPTPPPEPEPVAEPAPEPAPPAIAVAANRTTWGRAIASEGRRAGIPADSVHPDRARAAVMYRHGRTTNARIGAYTACSGGSPRTPPLSRRRA